jgi:hypothetical protein
MDLVSLSYYIAPVIGMTTIIIGTGAILKPEPMSKNFGITASGTAAPFVQSVGIRDIFMGLTVLILYFNQLWFPMALIQFCIGLVALSDFAVVKNNGDQKASMIHLAGAMAVIGYGVWLLFI